MPAESYRGSLSRDPKMLFRISLVEFERNELQPRPAPRKNLPRAGLGIRALVR
jgi:hypothetical protein